MTIDLILVVPPVRADELKFDLKSKKAKIAIQKYNEAKRKIKKLEKRSRTDLIRTLEGALKYERTEGDLDEAIKIRDHFLEPPMSMYCISETPLKKL